MDRRVLLLFFLGLVVFGFRLTNIEEMLYDDEANFAYSLTVMDGLGFNHEYSSPHLWNILYKPFIALAGLKVWIFRLLPWLLGILNTCLLYFFASRRYGEKTAFWSTLLMLLAFYPTLASLQLDVEGNLVMASVMLFFFSYLEYEKARETYPQQRYRHLFWQLLSGVGLGVAVISKYNSVYLVLVLTAYALLQERGNLRKIVSSLFPVFLVGFILFLCSLLLGIIASPQHWLEFVPLISWQQGFSGKYQADLVSIQALSMYLLWATPLLLGGYVLYLSKREKQLLLPGLWVTGSILFYVFIMTSGSHDRYFMHTIPALAVLLGYALAQVALSRRHLFITAALTSFFLALFFLANLFPVKYTPRIPAAYLQELLSGNASFLFSYTSASGPTLGVSFLPILLAFVFCGIGLLGLMIFSKWRTVFLVLFLSVGIAFNLFLVAEYLVHPTSIDPSSVQWEMITDVEASPSQYPFPIYSNNAGLLWYFDHRYWHDYHNVMGLSDYETDDAVGLKLQQEMIEKRGGTALILHFPPLPDDSPVFSLMKNCSLQKQFFSKDAVVGEIYNCQKWI